jgi:drug/metabolite transporter (DMT)-like permease
MSKTASLFSALLCTLIWGTTFIAQDTGMDDIGPFTFNAVRFFVGFLAVAPLAFIFERKNILKVVRKDQKQFTNLAILIGLSLFLGSALQQVALLYTDVANGPIYNFSYL